MTWLGHFIDFYLEEKVSAYHFMPIMFLFSSLTQRRLGGCLLTKEHVNGSRIVMR